MQSRRWEWEFPLPSGLTQSPMGGQSLWRTHWGSREFVMGLEDSSLRFRPGKGRRELEHPWGGGGGAEGACARPFLQRPAQHICPFPPHDKDPNDL